MAKLIVIRGIPGSGKSTLARKLLAEGTADVHFEADMFFELNSAYKFQPEKIGAAHQWCQNQVKAALAAGKNVIVSNTFVKKWEMEAYVKYAAENSIPVELHICRGEYQNVHGVPTDKVQQMKNRFEE